jgi:tRNA(Ile)-lysidine synthetase-like protein
MFDIINNEFNILFFTIGVMFITWTIIVIKITKQSINISKLQKESELSPEMVKHTGPSGFQYLLESPQNYNFDNKYLDSVNSANEYSVLVKCIDNFCQTNNVYQNGVIVSLSGGVDSMVTLAILLHLRTIYNFQIFTASIDYGLREESNEESKFLEEYTKMFGIKSYISYVSGYSRKKEDSGKRSEFEEESRNLRFNTYKKIIQENNLSPDCGVFVAHHQDDIVENIFTNSMKGCNILDLEVMKTISKINGVNIYRPLLGFKKQIIYDFAHHYGVPYFLDTTPKWSRRGKMRNEIFPLLDSVFGTDWRNKLKHLGTQSNEWGDYIDQYVIKPWYDEIKFGSCGIIVPIKQQPSLIYSIIIMKALHSIGESMIKRTSIEKIMDLINTKPKKVITLDKTRMAVLINNEQYLMIFDTKNFVFSDEQPENPYINIINGKVYSSLSKDNLIPSHIRKFLS